MKKKDICLIMGALLIVIIAFFAFGETYSKPQIELPLALSGTDTGLVKIDYNSYESKIQNEENFIVIIERTGCGYCESYMPIVETVANDLSIPVYYIDIADLTEEEYYALEDSNTYLKRENWGTPTTLLMSGKTVVDSIGQYVEEYEFREFINEDIILNNQEDN